MNLKFLYAKIVKKLRGSCIRNSHIDQTATIYSGTDFVESSVGKYTYIGYDCHIDRTDIGAFCSFSDHIFIGGAEHPMHWASTSPLFINITGSGTSKRFAQHQHEMFKRTHIGNDVWIGHGVTIKTGVNVGDGVVIGSGAVVTKDLPSYCIAAGVPAKIIGYRFDTETIQLLLQSKWWQLTDKQVAALAPMVKEPKTFALQAIKLQSNEKN